MVVLKDYAFVKFFLELILNICLLTAMLKCSYLINLSVCHNNIMWTAKNSLILSHVILQHQ